MSEVCSDVNLRIWRRTRAWALLVEGPVRSFQTVGLRVEYFPEESWREGNTTVCVF